MSLGWWQSFAMSPEEEGALGLPRPKYPAGTTGKAAPRRTLGVRAALEARADPGGMGRALNSIPFANGGHAGAVFTAWSCPECPKGLEWVPGLFTLGRRRAAGRALGGPLPLSLYLPASCRMKRII